ncbi:MAG: hypothetical protein IMY82_05205 [Chloroflexi bacterium]|nr:hypothetical protein [Chloroflexota bacterium]
MGRKNNNRNRPKKVQNKQEVITSLLDKMEDGREFESLVKYKAVNIDITSEIKNSLREIRNIRKRPIICYLGNVVNTSIKAQISIDNNDDLPFSEMVSGVPAGEKALDIILVTSGGSAQQVAKFVDKLRPRFDSVAFLLPYMAMSAGTIFAMSGDEIIMGKNSYIGPTDPQVPNKDGFYVPAQALLTLVSDIQKKGEDLLSKGQNPAWSDLQILRQIDAKELGNAISASKYSTELVKGYLYNHKFKNWHKHSDERLVTDDEKKKRAEEIAEMLCSHAQWKTHSRGITRDVAWDECKIKITHSDSSPELDKALRRFWALMYWVFENTPMYKVFISEEYSIFRNERIIAK